MGQTSQRGTPPNKAFKRKGAKRKTNYPKGRRDDSGPQFVCKVCLRNAERLANPELPSLHKPHHALCSENRKNKRELKEKEMLKGQQRLVLSKKPAPAARQPPAAAEPPPLAAKPPPSVAAHKQKTMPGASKPMDCLLSCQKLMAVIRDKHRRSTISLLYKRKNGEKNAPTQLGAVIHYILLDVLPSRYSKTDNTRTKGSLNSARADWLETHVFSKTGGMPMFEIPMHDHRKKPDPDYAVIQGNKVWIACWELIYDGLMLDCPCCATSASNPSRRCQLQRCRFPFIQENGAGVVSVPVFCFITALATKGSHYYLCLLLA